MTGKNGSTAHNTGQEPVNGKPKTLSETEMARANLYLMLSQLLGSPPNEVVLAQIATLQPDDTEFGIALGELSAATRATIRERIAEEHESLFVGVPTPMLMPYASYYLTGSLFGRPLAKLRIDMVQFGIATSEKTTEPEDHIGPLFETMAAIILGGFGDSPAALTTQRLFFDKHIVEWTPQFFADLEAAKPADYYAHVARVGALFIEIERQAFRMAI